MSKRIDFLLFISHAKQNAQGALVGTLNEKTGKIEVFNSFFWGGGGGCFCSSLNYYDQFISHIKVINLMKNVKNRIIFSLNAKQKFFRD